MSNVLVEKDKLDILATAISNKSGEPLTLTLDEMVEAVDSIEAGSAEPVLQAKTYTVDSAGTETITADSGYDGLSSVSVSVPQADPLLSFNAEFYTDNNVRKWRGRGDAVVYDDDGYYEGYIGQGSYTGEWEVFNAVPTNTTITPTESTQTIGGANYMMEGAVTVGAISSTYVGSGITQRSSSDLTASGATVTVPSGYYSAQASKSVASGSATPASSISGSSATVSTGTNTLTLSKTVSNTPQVTAGYIASGTAGNTSVSLTASVTTKGATTYNTSSTDQTIASGTYLTGIQTIRAVTTSNLTADNIKSGVTVTVGDSADADRILSVTGTYSGGGGGSSGVVTGTLTVASNVNTSTNTTITTTTAIGFTPKKFLFYRSDRSATSNHVNQASFITLGSSYYVRTMTRYSSNALSTSGNANNWTTQTAGYLYYNSNTIYFRSSSSYILPSGTWYWVAIE